MGTMPGWCAKLPELWRIDEYFSPGNAAGGGSLRKRYEKALKVLEGGGSLGQAIFADPTDKVDHFKKHWAGKNESSAFFPTVTDDPNYDSAAYLDMMNQAFIQAIKVALDTNGRPKPLATSWVCAPGTGFLGAAVTNGPSVVTLLIVTPPYRQDVNDGRAGTRVNDHAWMWKLDVGAGGETARFDTAHVPGMTSSHVPDDFDEYVNDRPPNP